MIDSSGQLGSNLRLDKDSDTQRIILRLLGFILGTVSIGLNLICFYLLSMDIPQSSAVFKSTVLVIPIVGLFCGVISVVLITEKRKSLSIHIMHALLVVLAYTPLFLFAFFKVFVGIVQGLPIQN